MGTQLAGWHCQPSRQTEGIVQLTEQKDSRTAHDAAGEVGSYLGDEVARREKVVPTNMGLPPG